MDASAAYSIQVRLTPATVRNPSPGGRNRLAVCIWPSLAAVDGDERIPILPHLRVSFFPLLLPLLPRLNLTRWSPLFRRCLSQVVSTVRYSTVRTKLLERLDLGCGLARWNRSSALAFFSSPSL